MEESKYQMERDLEEQRDKQEKAISEMKRNLERSVTGFKIENMKLNINII